MPSRESPHCSQVGCKLAMPTDITSSEVEATALAFEPFLPFLEEGYYRGWAGLEDEEEEALVCSSHSH